MKKIYQSIFLTIIVTFILSACNGGGSGGSSSNTCGSGTNSVTPLTPPDSANAYLTVTITPDTSSTVCNYYNAPCVSLTICNPNSPSSCDTVNSILLDSGSYGLRVFRSLLTSSNLTIESNAGESVAECVRYGDTSGNWGPVALANIKFTDGEPVTATNIPIQLIDSSFVGASARCPEATTTRSATPAGFHLNGILGVGPYPNDSRSSGDSYYHCNNSICTKITNIPESQYVANPIAALSEPEYNNGITLKFPQLSSCGGSNVTGYAIFGINTNSDNQIENQGIYYYQIVDGNIVPITMPTTYNGANLEGFLDSGSNGLFFNDSSIPECSNDWYCPSNTLSLSATNADYALDSITASFSIANANDLFGTANIAFANLGSSLPSGLAGTFDYGMPFFYGKTVSEGFESKVTSSTPISGPYWAF